jgi:hypothetical protein
MSDGYKVEISALNRVLSPLDESVMAAKEVRDKKDDLASHAKDAGSEKVRGAVEGFLSSWAYGMGQLVDYAGEVGDKLSETIAAYQKAEELGIKGFTPTQENLDFLPSGPVGEWTYERTKPDLPGDKAGWEKTADGWQEDFENWAFG